MSVSDAHKRASYKYNSGRDNIMIRPDKKTGEAIRAAAAARGESIQQYILAALAAFGAFDPLQVVPVVSDDHGIASGPSGGAGGI